MRRGEAISGSALTNSGVLRLTYFTANKSLTAANVKTVSGATAAGATPTLCRVGIYTVADNGDVTLVASTPNTTSLWAGIGTEYTTALSAPYDIIAGQRYALGVIVVTAAAAPTLTGSTFSQSSYLDDAPRLTSAIGSQTDLPASVAVGSLVANGNRTYAEILP